jgi:hypothetical protein
MKTRDTTEQLVWDSEVSYAVLGRDRDFVLVRLHVNGETEATQLAEAKRRNFFYAGVLGLRDGQPSAESSGPETAFTLTLAALAFSQEMAASGRLRPKDDFCVFAEALFRLPDNRTA